MHAKACWSKRLDVCLVSILPGNGSQPASALKVLRPKRWQALVPAHIGNNPLRLPMQTCTRIHCTSGCIQKMACPSIAERRKHCTFITHPCTPNMQKHPCMHVTWLDMPKPTSCPCMVSTQIERRGGSSAKNQASLPQHENYVARLSLQKKGKTSRTCTSYCIPLVPTQQKYQ